MITVEIFLIIVMAIGQIYTSVLYGAPSDGDSHKPAVFTDPERVEKVKATAKVVENVFREYADKEHMPGFVYEIVLDGKLIYSGGFGFSNLEKQIPVSTKSLFRIASMSKSFTALAILQLRRTGAPAGN